MATRKEVVAAARRWVNTRWHHQGRSSEGGIDCLGLIVTVGSELDLFHYDVKAYRAGVGVTNYFDHFLAAGLIRINPADGRDGDIAVFRTSAYPCHMGFIGMKDGVRQLIHASLSHRKVIEEPMLGAMDVPLVAVLRMPGVED